MSLKQLLLCVACLIAGAAPTLSQQAATTPETPAPTTVVTKPGAARKPVTFHIAMRDGLRFDPPRLSAKPGDDIIIELENADSTHQMHNFLVAQPGKREEVVKQALELGEKGPEQQFVPPNPSVLVHSQVLAPDKKQTIRFTVPDAPGVYPYVCTFPGHGMVMYGALYAAVPMPPIDKDPHIPPNTAQTMVAGGGRRPFVQRMFVPNAGPAAIAVALSGDQNFVWDAGECRLRYAWRGGFIDASEHWRGKGHDLAKVPTDPWWSAPLGESPWRFAAADGPVPKMKFLGYRLEEGVPEFRYRAGATEVFEKIAASETGAALHIRRRIPNAPAAVFYRLPSANDVKWTTSAGVITHQVIHLTAAQAAEFTLTLTPTQP